MPDLSKSEFIQRIDRIVKELVSTEPVTTTENEFHTLEDGTSLLFIQSPTEAFLDSGTHKDVDTVCEQHRQDRAITNDIINQLDIGQYDYTVKDKRLLIHTREGILALTLPLFIVATHDNYPEGEPRPFYYRSIPLVSSESKGSREPFTSESLELIKPNLIKREVKDETVPYVDYFHKAFLALKTPATIAITQITPLNPIEVDNDVKDFRYYVAYLTSKNLANTAKAREYFSQESSLPFLLNISQNPGLWPIGLGIDVSDALDKLERSLKVWLEEIEDTNQDPVDRLVIKDDWYKLVNNGYHP